MKEVYEGIKGCWEEKKRAVIATIIDVNGSAYRREGARCIIHEDGSIDGMISGGCVESDLVEHALDVLEKNIPKKVVYDFSWDADELWGLGVGCNGIITVFLEAFDPINQHESAQEWVLEFENRNKSDKPYYFITVISSNDGKLQPGVHWKEEDARLKGSPKKPNYLMNRNAKGVELTLFVEEVKPLPRLLIFGSGPDAALLAKRANELSWRVSVIDHRAGYLDAYFPNVEKWLISRGEYNSIEIPEDAFAVVMTHNLELDSRALQTLLAKDISYIGLLGSQERKSKLMSILNKGDQINPGNFSMIHSPVGLDIGAENPEEITLSILSEMIAFKNGRSGGPICQKVNN